jgi:hypothetical protein
MEIMYQCLELETWKSYTDHSCIEKNNALVLGTGTETTMPHILRFYKHTIHRFSGQSYKTDNI